MAKSNHSCTTQASAESHTGTPGTVFHVRTLGFVEIFCRDQRLTDGEYTPYYERVFKGRTAGEYFSVMEL